MDLPDDGGRDIIFKEILIFVEYKESLTSANVVT